MVSSSSTSQMMRTYDVFISFRGADVRNDFLGHLQDALGRNGIKAFVDNNLERGEEITKSVLEKIEDSYLSIVIFSKNYAFSPWCLDELVKIFECMETMGQVIIPIFYRVNPNHIQQMTGRYEEALVQHRQEFVHSSVESWSHALKKIGSLSGLVSKNIRPDSKLIDEIVNHISKKLIYITPSNSYKKELVGIDSRIKCVESLLCLDSQKVRVVGIWGMGGIGKSTIAKEVYHRIEGQFKNRCFVENVRERFEKGELNIMQDEILSEILGQNISNNGNGIRLSPPIVQCLARRKVLLVLDDVSDSDQIELLIGKPDICGQGSRLIITSRDKHLLRNANAKIYEVERLNCSEAVNLFCLYAFKQSIPKQGFKTLSIKAVEYAKGNPLAVKVLGSNLYQRNVEEWEDELEKLEDKSDDKIGKILRTSYDGLCEDDKKIFIDIACFLNWEDLDYVMSMLKKPGSRIGISHLCEKSLISISGNKLHMHDLLQQLGKDITREEKQLGKHRILWHHENVYYLLTKIEGTEAVEGISLDMSKISDIELKATTFESMFRIRFLKFYDPSLTSKTRNKLHLPGGLAHLPADQLRLLQWDMYPLNSLPSNFCPKNLVKLRMRHSRVNQLWHGCPQLGNLKVIDLTGSSELTELPDFSGTPNLEVLELIDCANLSCIPDNLGNIKSLMTIDLSGTAIEELPESICKLKLLKYMHLRLCRKLHKLPDHSANLESLEDSFAKESKTKHLPSSINQLQILQCNSQRIDGFISPPLTNFFANLRSLCLSFCGLSEFPKAICCLALLRTLYVDGNDFKSIPKEIIQLSHLYSLELSYCKRLEYLPELPSLFWLRLSDCMSLKSAFSSPEQLQKLEAILDLDLGNCVKLGSHECHQIMDHAIQKFEASWNSFNEGSIYLAIPGSEVPGKMKYQSKKGTCLCLSLLSKSKALKCMDFCFCVIFDPKVSVRDHLILSCLAIFVDESKHIYRAESSYTFHGDCHIGKHVFIWTEKLEFHEDKEQYKENFPPCVIHFTFNAFCDDNESSDVITGCGINPLFGNEDWKQILDEEEEEEEGEDCDNWEQDSISISVRKRKRTLKIGNMIWMSMRKREGSDNEYEDAEEEEEQEEEQDGRLSKRLKNKLGG